MNNRVIPYLFGRVLEEPMMEDYQVRFCEREAGGESLPSDSIKHYFLSKGSM